MALDFTNIHYLKTGNTKQQAAFQLLTNYAVFEKLAGFQPILAGTIPIEIDTADSDLDIICCVAQQADFTHLLHENFAGFPCFELEKTVVNGLSTILCRFMLDEFPIEIFGQDQPTIEQQAYRHLLVEYRILNEQGEEFREKIIKLKKRGVKTEPAFAQLLGLQGDPYKALLELE